MTKSQLNAFVILLVVVGSGAVYQQFGWAQAPVKEGWEPRREEEAKRAADELRRQGEEFKRQGEEFKRQAKEFGKVQQKIFTLAKGGAGMDGQIRAAAESLRDAEGDEAKMQAREKLKDLLDKFFEEDMTHRQEAVADLEERLQKLRAQLDRRRAKKQEIVDLQMKIVVNEADGLGFSSQSDLKDFNIRVNAPVEIPIIEPHFGDGVMIMPPPASPSPSADGAPR